MAWWRPGPDVDEARWVVLDVEASGLDPHRERLLAIAAARLHVDWSTRRLSLALGDSFEVVLRQAEASPRENILLHGIGVQRQQAGVPAADALRSFTSWCGASPLLAFHAGFDRALIQRHLKQAGVALPRSPWLDIEPLCGVAFPHVRARSLDEWMDHFGIRCAQRHQAAADVLAECELLQRVWPAISGECRNWRDVQKLAARHRWIARARA